MTLASDAFIKELQPRRTIYNLTKDIPISDEDVVEIVRAIVDTIPSSFNSQTTRAIVLFGKNHEKLWGDIAYNALKEQLASKPEVFETQTGPKLKAFEAAHGTVVFFEDDSVIKQFEQNFPRYAPNFIHWAGHSSGASQIAIWSALALDNVGANLQHYSPLIDDRVHETWNVPKNWRVTAQLVFGGVGTPAQKPEHLDPKEVVQVFN